ncbi:MAG: hypothetical protein JWP50_2517 [Phenylobacterium sp.]|nr:hypothetical protein [Phenylobacterium sp.]
MADAGLRPFSDSGYEILDDGIGRGEVVIWSVDPVAPRLGDEFLIECDGRAYDAEVEQLTVVKGGWSAKCRAAPVGRRPS